MRNSINHIFLKEIIFSFFFNLWYNYKFFVENATKGLTHNESQESIWRDNIFTSLITYLLPVCLIALVPGVYIGIRDGYLFIAVFDLFAALSIAVIVLNKKINLTFRKLYVIFILYCLAIVLMIAFGLAGPGIIYLLALSVLTAIIFPRNYAFGSIVLNILVSIFCAVIIGLKLFNSPLITEYGVGPWIAISSNLVFLSWLCVVLISKTINSLENTFKREVRLKKELQAETNQRAETNKQLKESEGHYKSLFIMNPSPMWVMDVENFQFLQVNESAIQNYGYTNEEFLSMNISDIKLEEDMENYSENLLNDLKSGSTLNRIVQHRRKNQEIFYAEVRINPIPFKEKEAVLVMARDMTEQMNFTKAIERQNARLLEIAYIQSHIVRAPLARIMGLVDIVVQNVNEIPDPKVLSYLDQSAKEFDEIIKMIVSKTSQA
jgi:PAS domain S-box-containing protein